MYLEIHPFWYDSASACANAMLQGDNKEKDFIRESPPRVINLSCIKQLTEQKYYDGSIELTRLQVSDDHTEDILVSKEEGEKIKKILLEGSGHKDNTVAEELEILTGVLRNILKVLQARLH